MAEQPACVVYCRSWCGDCHRALHWLEQHGYEFQSIDIDQDPEARRRCIELAGKVVTPTFEIGDECIVDFDPEALAKALAGPERT